jgi:hypothetical protein
MSNENDIGSTVTLKGSHFRAPIPLVMLIISGFCLLSFVVIVIRCGWVKARNGKTNNLLHWAIIGVSIVFMISFVPYLPTKLFTSPDTSPRYFGLYFTDRILHEIEMKVFSMYFRINIPLETFQLLGDLFFLTFAFVNLGPALLEHVGTSKQHTTFLSWGHRALLSVLFGLFVADRITFIIKLVTDQLPTQSTDGKASTTNAQIGLISGAYPKLNTAFYGVYLGGALSLAATSIHVLLKLKKAGVLHRTFLIFLPIVSTSLVIRTLVNFFYALYFKLLKHRQTLIMQLIYLAFYGLLSVAMYASSVKIAATEEDWESVVTVDLGHVEYGLVITGTGHATSDWRPQMHQFEQPKPGVVNGEEAESYNSSAHGGTSYGQGPYAFEYQPQQYDRVH